jgi:hypothetical protein
MSLRDVFSLAPFLRGEGRGEGRRSLRQRKQTALMGMIEETSILKLMTISASVFIFNRVQSGILLCLFQRH